MNRAKRKVPGKGWEKDDEVLPPHKAAAEQVWEEKNNQFCKSFFLFPKSNHQPVLETERWIYKL